MITERDDERSNDRAVLAWSLVVSGAINLAIWFLVIWFGGLNEILMRAISPQQEAVMSSSVIHLDKDVPVPEQAHTQPQPQPQKPAKPRPQQQPQKSVRHDVPKPKPQPVELAKIVPNAPPEPPQTKAQQQQAALSAQLAQQEVEFEREAQALHDHSAPISVATIDPNRRQSSTRSYQMNFSRISQATGPGNGIFTPLQQWSDRGMNCYYGRYDWTYPDGSTEGANIPWGFCYSPSEDPVARGIREFPFPVPMAGYRLPVGTVLAPVEQHVYDAWLHYEEHGS
jgi:hypothetical protein